MSSYERTHGASEWQMESTRVIPINNASIRRRCSTRSNLAKEFEMQIREFTATLECHLIDLLRKRLEELNEPDLRFLIMRSESLQSSCCLVQRTFLEPERIRRHLSSNIEIKFVLRALCELGDSKSSVLSQPLYHMLSPTRPAHRVWTMCTEDPERLKNLVSEVCDMARISYDKGDEQNSCQIKFSAALPSAWSAANCAKYLIEKKEAAEDILSERRARHFGSYRSMKNGPFSKLAKEKSDSDKISERQLSVEDTKTQIPLEPSVFIRKVRQQSFRESSLTDESDSACALKEEAFNSTSPSAASSIPVYQTDSSYDSRDLQAPLCEQTISSCNPSTSTTLTMENQSTEPNFIRFGERLFSRPIDIISLPNIFSKKQLLAISDSCGGVYIVTCKGEVLQHLPTRDGSASSLTIDPTNWRLLVSVMHSKGRSVHAFDITNRFKKVEIIPCPKEPKIELSRTRWITVSPRGELFIVSGDNHRSAIWMYNKSRKSKFFKSSFSFSWMEDFEGVEKTRYQYLRVAEDQAEYKAVVLLTCDAAQNRILLFVADHTGTLINEYDLTKTYKLNECIKNPASAIVDSLGNLLVLDYATSRLWALLSSTKGMRHIKEIIIPIPLGPQEALGITAHGDWIYMTCFARREVICLRYLINGVLAPSCCTVTLETPKSDRRAISLPRPTRKPNQV
ncbi:Beta-lactamase and RNA-metabolising metallo-beta-lactamase domain containing protein [Dirofilaria immitis]|nr:Beta-lactamase and RNA-metabolising metallo-beta-lactamase domain containing protein [Dirofilaria immitis]